MKTPKFFSRQSQLRKWFEKNHLKETELWIGYYKVATEKPGITWSQSVDEAICFGWIDGIRKSIDANSHVNRFTPRKQRVTGVPSTLRKLMSLVKRG